MTQETILANAKLILGDEVVTGSLRMRDGMLIEMGTGTSVPKDAVDCDGDYLAPGLIELHTDNLDRHMLPPPKVEWPHAPAALLLSARQLGDRWGKMARGIATVTANPARSVGLMDRGVLALGKRADVVRVSCIDGVAVTNQVWSQGGQVA